MIDVSIVVPIYNVEKYLAPSVKLMLEQTHTNIEVILVDDGAKDNSGKICDEFAEKDSRVKVIHKPNGGLPSARNAGMDAAVGKYIYFCDPDDLISVDLISDNFKLMEKYKAEICVFGYELYREEEGRNIKEITYRPLNNVCLDYKGFWDNFREEEHLGFTIWCRMYLRSYLVENNVRSRNVSIGEDDMFAYDIYEAGFNRIVYNTGIYYYYIKHKGGAMSVYKADRLETNYKIACRFKEVVEKCDPVKGRYDDLINEAFIRPTLDGFRYLTVLPVGKMYADVKEHMGKSMVKKVFSETDIRTVKGRSRKIRIFLLKYRMFRLYTWLLYFNKFLKSLKASRSNN